MESKPKPGTFALLTVARSAPLIVALAAFINLCVVAEPMHAQGTLAYSFEDGLQGFGPNGGGVTITQDTIGATEGTMSAKYSIVAGATFVGMLTGELAPQIADPPGLDFVIFDLTLTEQFPAEGFVSAGITIFGVSQPDRPNGQIAVQAQFSFPNDEAPLGDLAVGRHEIRLDLISVAHPLTFEPGNFSDIFGTLGSGPDDVIPTGFQIYINKSGIAPWTGYIDNIRLGVNPTLDANFNDDNAVNNADLAIWKGAYRTTTAGDADGDMDTDGNDFLVWQQQVGPVTPISAVPEPTALSLVAAAAFGAGAKRRRLSRVRRAAR